MSVARRDQKKEKALRNLEYAKKHRRRQGRRGRRTLEQLNHCRVPGHPPTCQYATCPRYNRDQ